MKAKDLNNLTLEELQTKLAETRTELLNLRLRKKTGQVDKTHKITQSRREVARLLTVLNEKKH